VQKTVAQMTTKRGVFVDEGEMPKVVGAPAAAAPGEQPRAPQQPSAPELR
jgi:hypothetical protein